MLISCRVMMKRPALSEVLLEIETEGGLEEVVVFEDSVEDGHLEVGKGLAKKDGFALVELPRESASGKWRVWVPLGKILQTA